MLDVIETLNPELVPTFKIPLSRRVIVRRISDMSENLQDQLRAKAAGFIAFSLALDESTDITDTAISLIRGVDAELNVTEELLDMVSLKDTTMGQDILEGAETAGENLELAWEKLKTVTTDGAPAMRGAVEGFLGLLRKKLNRPLLPGIHCFPHQENLIAKTFAMQDIMKTVVKTVNFIRSHAINHRQFKELLADLEECPDIPYHHTEVRFLSKGKLCKRFLELREAIAIF